MEEKAKGNKENLFSQKADSKLTGHDNPAVDSKDDGDHTRSETSLHKNGNRRKGVVTMTEEVVEAGNGNGTADLNDSTRKFENGRRKGTVRVKNPGMKSPPECLPAETPSYHYPKVCAYCHSLWDKKGETDLTTLCECNESKLHVHKSCINIWMKKDGRIRCEQCKSLYKYRNEDIQSMVQRVDMCIIVVLIPVGVVVTVCACLMWDAVRYARATGGAHSKLGFPIEQFTGVCIVMGFVLIAAFFATKIILCPKADHKTKEGQEQSVVKKV